MSDSVAQVQALAFLESLPDAFAIEGILAHQHRLDNVSDGVGLGAEGSSLRRPSSVTMRSKVCLGIVLGAGVRVAVRIADDTRFVDKSFRNDVGNLHGSPLSCSEQRSPPSTTTQCRLPALSPAWLRRRRDGGLSVTLRCNTSRFPSRPQPG